jgi:hypothetical protein
MQVSCSQALASYIAVGWPLSSHYKGVCASGAMVGALRAALAGRSGGYDIVKSY